MNRPKPLSSSQITRTELVYAAVVGAEEALLIDARFAIQKILRSIGQNARGEFRVQVSFFPDGGAK